MAIRTRTPTKPAAGRRRTAGLVPIRRGAALAMVVLSGLAASTAAVPPARAVAAPPAHPVPIEAVPLPMGRPTDVNNQGQIIGSGDIGAMIWQNGVSTPIGDLGGGNSGPADINDHGQVVGWSDTASGELHAFLWQRGTMTDLGTLGGPSSAASAVNERGDVVGLSTTADGSRAYFLWRRGRMIQIPVPGDIEPSPQIYINNRGQVAGVYYSTEEQQPPTRAPLSRVWLYDGDRLTDLGALGGYDARVRHINDRGQILALEVDPEWQGRVLLWQRGAITEVGKTELPPWMGSMDLNNRGQVGFTGPAPAGGERAYLWHRGVLTDLGALDGGQSGVSDINDRGDVTGISTTPGHRGYVWRNGVMTELDVLGPDEISQPNHINDNGLVIGTSATEFDIHAVAWYTR